MTICIAAIAENNKIIAMTDKMVTLGAPVVTRYEITESNKAVELGPKIVGLFAGNVVYANEILELAKQKIQPTMTDVLEVAKIVQTSFQEYFQTTLTELIFNRFGITLPVFMGNQKNLDEDLVKKINEIIINTNLQVEIIIAGIDTRPHIYLIGNPGTLNTLDALGYACIGSGSQHATFSLIEAEYNAGISKEKSLYALIEAKKRAEYDPGVGQLSDIVIVDGGFNKLPKTKVDEIDKQYKISLEQIKKSKKESSAKIYGIV